MVSFLTAKNGETTARYRGVLLHSSYNPRREAERFTETVAVSRCYVILGGGVGHLAAALAARRPSCRICTLHPDQALSDAATQTPGVHLAIQDERRLEGALADAFGAELSFGFEVLSWEPARKADAAWFARWEKALIAVARRRHHSLLTTGYFGYRWLLNSFRNSRRCLSREPWRLDTTKSPVLVAPGPSLEDGLPWLRRERRRRYIVAVSSAYLTLRRYGVEPDLLVHTDGGYWATRHLSEETPSASGFAPVTATGAALASPLAATIRAALPSRIAPREHLFLYDPGSPVETAVANTFSTPLLPLPGHGTVTGTALRLLKELFPVPPLLLGVDLASRGYRTHCRPHTFESFLRGGTDRLNPLPMVYRRRLGEISLLAGGWEISRTQELYAEALRGELSARELPPRRLNPSPVPLPTSRARAAGSEEPPTEERWRQKPHRVIPPRAAPLGPREVIDSWLEKLEAWTPASAAGILPAAAEASQADDSRGPLLPELAQFLALPELLRLRRAADRGEAIGDPFRELRSRIRERLHLIRERTGE